MALPTPPTMNSPSWATAASGPPGRSPVQSVRSPSSSGGLLVLIGVGVAAVGFIVAWYAVDQLFGNGLNAQPIVDRFATYNELELVSGILVGIGILLAGVGWTSARLPEIGMHRGAVGVLALAGSGVVAAGFWAASLSSANEYWRWGWTLPPWFLGIGNLTSAFGGLAWAVAWFLARVWAGRRPY